MTTLPIGLRRTELDDDFPDHVGDLLLDRDRDDPALEGLVRDQLVLLGEDPDREGLLRTPDRVARSLRWLTRGYEMTAEDAVGSAVFEEEHQQMVLVRDIGFYSL
jgi:GTP cyclohydrolase I